jgi:hypothetical protein
MGMGVAVEANVRTATAAKESINKAFKLSFYAGSVMGLAMVGLAVLGMTVIFLLTGDAETILGFSFGASALALLAKPSWPLARQSFAKPPHDFLHRPLAPMPSRRWPRHCCATCLKTLIKVH